MVIVLIWKTLAYISEAIGIQKVGGNGYLQPNSVINLITAETCKNVHRVSCNI